MQPRNSENLLYFYARNKGFNKILYLLSHVMWRMESQTNHVLPHITRQKMRLKEHNSEINDHTQKPQMFTHINHKWL